MMSDTKKFSCFLIITICCFTLHVIFYAAAITYIKLKDYDFKEYELESYTLYMIYVKFVLYLPFLSILCIPDTKLTLVFTLLTLFHIADFLLSAGILTSYFATWQRELTKTYGITIGFVIIQNTGMIIINILALFIYGMHLATDESNSLNINQSEVEKDNAFEMFSRTGTQNRNQTTNVTSQSQNVKRAPLQNSNKNPLTIEHNSDPGVLNDGYSEGGNSEHSFTSSTDDNAGQNIHEGDHGQHFADESVYNTLHQSTTRPSYDMNIFNHNDAGFHQGVTRVRSEPSLYDFNDDRMTNEHKTRTLHRSQTIINQSSYENTKWPPLPSCAHHPCNEKTENKYENQPPPLPKRNPTRKSVYENTTVASPEHAPNQVEYKIPYDPQSKRDVPRPLDQPSIIGAPNVNTQGTYPINIRHMNSRNRLIGDDDVFYNGDSKMVDYSIDQLNTHVNKTLRGNSNNDSNMFYTGTDNNNQNNNSPYEKVWTAQGRVA